MKRVSPTVKSISEWEQSYAPACECFQLAEATNVDELVESHKPVTPAKHVLDSDRGAGVHNILECLDSRVRGNDRNGAKRTFYERINLCLCHKLCMDYLPQIMHGLFVFLFFNYYFDCHLF